MGVSRYWWRHQIRVEEILTPDTNQSYPFCSGGKGICPPEDCGGPWGFMKAKQEYSIFDTVERFKSLLEEGNWAECREKIRELQPMLLVYLNRFDRHTVNQRLQQYMTVGSESMLFEQRIL